jgi:hypothetical protein
VVRPPQEVGFLCLFIMKLYISICHPDGNRSTKPRLMVKGGILIDTASLKDDRKIN